MPLLDRRTLAVARTILILVALGAFIYGARHTLIAFVLAIFFAYLIEPLVSEVERWHAVSRGSRALAIAEVYFVLAIVLAGVVLKVEPYVASEGPHLLSSAPSLLSRLSSGEIVHSIGVKQKWSYTTQHYAEHLLDQYRPAILAGIKQIGLQLGAIAAETIWVILIPILAIPFLTHRSRTFDFGLKALRLHPPVLTFVRSALRDVDNMAAHYIRAQLVLTTLAMVVYTVVLVAAGVQYGALLGVTAGMLEFIPMIGPLLGAIAILGVAFLTGFHPMWTLFLFLGGWRLLQDYFTSPRLMHSTLKLHPYVVIFAVLAGAEIAGFLGVFLSIPIAATLNIIWRCWRAYSDSEALQEADASPSQPRAA